MTTGLSSLRVASQIMGLEEFDATLASVEGRTTLTGREQAPWRHDTLVCDGVTLQVTQEGAANFYQGAGVGGHVVLGLGLPAASWVWANGRAIDSSCLFVAHGGDAVDSFAQGVCRYAILLVPVERFVESVGHLDKAESKRLMSGATHLGISRSEWRGAAELVGRVSQAMARGAISSPATGQAVVGELIATFVGAALRSPSPRPHRRRGVSRRRIVSQIRELLDSRSGSPHSVVELARSVGVSERTLRYAVHESLGVSPKRLLMLRQLRDMRRALLRASPGETVTSIAASHGVWEVGRFAQRYGELFGEKPSTTLAATRAAAPALQTASGRPPDRGRARFPLLADSA